MISVTEISKLFFFPDFLLRYVKVISISSAEISKLLLFFRFSFSNSQNRYCSSISNRGSLRVSGYHDENENRKFERFEQEVRDKTFAEGGRYDVFIIGKMPVSWRINLEYACMLVYS